MEEKEFRKLMQYSKLEINFPDFEENVIKQIHAKESNRRSVWKSLKLSWVFFFLGSFFGIFAAQLLANLKVPFFAQNPRLIMLIIEVLIVFIIASQFDKLIQFTFKKRD